MCPNFYRKENTPGKNSVAFSKDKSIRPEGMKNHTPSRGLPMTMVDGGEAESWARWLERWALSERK